MTWNRKYWDIFHRFYWDPKVLGLKKTSAHYTRTLKIDEAMTDFEKCEEPLNQLFNITFAIAPDAVINKLLIEPLGFNDNGPFQSLVRQDFVEKYGWQKEANVTESDGFFTTRKSLVGVELKQGNGRSNLGQLMKYVALMVWEELHTERHDQLGLLLITPQKNSDKVWHQIGLVKPGIDDEFINNLPELPKNKRLNRTIEKLYQDHQEVFHSACRRLKISHISWQELHEGIRNLMDGLNCLDPGEQTLYKLLEGFDTQVVSHSGTNTI